MILVLQRLPADKVRGIYTIDKIPGRMPARALYLHPHAAASFLADLAPCITVSDMLRTAESSLNAVRTGRGAQRPGYSGHNYGFSIDIEVSEAMRALGFKTKRLLDDWMATRGWFCHRRDHLIEHEAWHYNFLKLAELRGGPPLLPAGTITSDELERLIQIVYGVELQPGDRDCQSMLALLHLYRGAIDGIIGPLSREAIAAFQRAWELTVDGTLGPKTRRTLAFVAAGRIVS